MRISPFLRRPPVSILRLIVLLAVPPMVGRAIADGGSGTAAAAPAADDEVPFVHRPDAADARRIVITTRSPKPAPTVAVFAPRTTLGETIKERPAIWWYLSRDTELPVKIAVNEPKRDEPLVEVTLRGKHMNGFHRFDLGAEDVPQISFKPGVPYEFAVSVVVNENSPSANPASIAKIQRTTRERPRGVDDQKDLYARAQKYREASLWYDYVDDLNNAIESNDKRVADLITRRRNLLAQEDLLFTRDGDVILKAANGQGGKP